MAESIDARQREQPQPDPLAREAATARIVQHRVAFHCWWSCLEACRGLRRAWSRFIWRLPDGNIRLWLPRRLPASRRRGWLECHVPDASPQRQGERQRIQAVIDSLFGFADVLFFEEGLHAPMAPRTGSVLDWLVQCEVAEHGLAEFVAREKSARIAEQRPAVRRLGRARVKALIHRVFDELEADNKEDYAIAQAFGLSRATFSRFAGRRWKWNNHRSVPDLWLNVAAIADRFPHFRELASSSGVLDRIEAIARFRSNGGPFDGR